MNKFNDIKTALAVVPQTVDADPVVTGVVDCLGFRRAVVTVALGAAESTNALTALKVEECATVGGTYTAIKALTGGTELGANVGFVFLAPGESGTTGQTVRFEIDLTQRKRFLKFSIATTASRVVAVVVDLCASERDLPTATLQGVDQLVEA